MRTILRNKASILNRLKEKIVVSNIWGCPCGSGYVGCFDKCTNTVSFESVFHRAFALIEDFSDKLLNSSECDFNHQLLDELINLHEHFNPARSTITKETDIFRARKDFELKKVINSAPFLGLDATESFVPPRKSISNMRANVAYHPVLYAASDEVTAFYEVRANKNDILNLCTITACRDLKLFNLCTESKDYKAGGLSQTNVFTQIIRFLISELFSEPVGTGDKIEEYIATQFIAEYIQTIHNIYLRYDVAEKALQHFLSIYNPSSNPGVAEKCVERLQTPYDGIIYNSQFTDGFNYCLFNYSDCVPIATKLKKVSEIDFVDYRL